MSNFKCASVMVTQLDLDKVVKSASLKTQSDQTLAMDVPAIKADVKSKLSKMRSVLGPTAQSRLLELKRGVLVSAAAPGCSTWQQLHFDTQTPQCT